MTDIYINSVSLLLPCSGAEGGSTFTDTSPNPKTITSVNTTIDTAVSKFGGGSAKFNGVDSYISVADSDDFWFDAGTFTIELHCRIASFAQSSEMVLLSQEGWGSNSSFELMVASPGLIYFSAYTDGAEIGMTSVSTLTEGVWAHIAISAYGGVAGLYIDGILDATASGGSIVTNSTKPLLVGAREVSYSGAKSLFFDGNIENIRITNGISRASSSFTPPSGPYDATVPPSSGVAQLQPPSPTALAYGGGFSAITAPMALVYAAASPTPSTAQAPDLTAPSPTLSSYSGAILALTAPTPTLRSTGHSSYGDRAAFLTAPSPTLTITTGANANGLSAPSPTLSASGTVTILAKAALAAPSPTLIAAGTVSGMAAATLTAPSPNLVGYGGAVCSVTLTGSPTLVATGTTGGVGSAQVTCPLFQLSAGATAQNRGSANLLSPSPRLGAQAKAWLTAPSARLTAIGTAVITATYEAYAVNLKHSDPNANDEITRYTNFPFTHVVRYKNSYYGANSTGLYLLEGTTDNGTPIPWAFETAMTDFKTPNKKTVAAAYFSGRLGPASTISLIEGEHTPSVYSFTTPRGTLAQNHRQKFGKGTKGRYYALSASGTGTCELDGIEPEVHQLTRRI